MKMRRLASIIALAGLFALAAGERSWTRAGSVSLEVSVQTNGLSPGFLEFDLSANSAPTSPTVSATIQNLVGGTPGVVGLSGGDFSGSLTSPPLVLNNNASLSFLQQGFTFLKFVTFDVTLSGSEVSATNPAAPNITGTLLSFFVEDMPATGSAVLPAPRRSWALHSTCRVNRSTSTSPRPPRIGITVTWRSTHTAQSRETFRPWPFSRSRSPPA